MKLTVTSVASRAGDPHPINEDRYLCEPELQLFAVLDGEVHEGYAAEVASATFGAHLRRDRGGRALTPADLVDAVEAANRAVFAAASVPRWRGCGTTLTCCAASNTTLHMAHVGDSRLYHLSGQSWRLVTRDHSLVEDYRRCGRDAEIEELATVHSNVITRALGFAPEVSVDTVSIELSPGDCVVLCTDGAWRPFDPRLAGAPPPTTETGRVLERIFERYTLDGERDNATALVVSVGP